MTDDSFSRRLPASAALAAGMFFAIGLVVRLLDLNRSLWLDELSTLWSIEGSLAQVFTRVPEVMGQSPFYFTFAWAAVQVFGEHEWALRLPSLIAIIGATVLVATSAATGGGRRAAVWAALLFWLCYPALWTSVDARPYALGLFFAALAVHGWMGLPGGGGRLPRAAWILGLAGVVWSHYLFVPFVAALWVVAAAHPRLRRCYGLRRLGLDALTVGVLVLPALWQVADLTSNRASHDWALAPNRLSILAPIIPFLLAMVMPGTARHAPRTRVQVMGLAAAIGAQLLALEVSGWLGSTLLTARYAYVVLVAAAVIAGINLGRLRAADTVAPLAVFALTTGLAIYANYNVTGSITGAGYQEWRQAVTALRADIAGRHGAPVLFRSGNAEDDLTPPGEFGWPATLAPLRSPGEAQPDWNVIPLTYRWSRPGRTTYFDTTLRARLDDEPVFYLLCLASDEPGSGGYCGPVREWVQSAWPDIEAHPLGPFRQITVVRFAHP